MSISARIQRGIQIIDSGGARRRLWTCALCLAMAGLVLWYDLWAYRGFSAPEAMDAAQVARNLAEGHGFTTQNLMPLRFFLLQTKAKASGVPSALSNGPTTYYPDFANAPVYPEVLAGLFKLTHPAWEIETKPGFWSPNGRFQRYRPEFLITLFNQILLLAVVVLAFFLAKKWFDASVAWLSAVVIIGSNELWQFSNSGLSTMLLILIFLGLAWCVSAIEAQARTEAPNPGRLTALAITAGLLAGLGMLTRYSLGSLILPLLLFLRLFGGKQKSRLIASAAVVFCLLVTPWLLRNYLVSGRWFGIDGYALMEGTRLFPGLTLLQSTDPQLTGADLQGGWLTEILHKLLHNLLTIFENRLPHLGGWVATLFFAGLLLGFRNPGPRRLRYFILMCLASLMAAQALGRTWLSDATPDFNSENLLVILTPLIVIFGVAFLLTLLDQMSLPNKESRIAVMVLTGGLLCLPLIATFLSSKTQTIAYPPYYPPEIQRVSRWLGPDELMMSDMPWAVAWYGQHTCIALSRDTQANFSDINDYFQPVKGVYLTTLTLDDKFFSRVLRSENDGWNRLVHNFVIKDSVDQEMAAFDEDALSGINVAPRKRTDFLNGFPLRTARSLDAGLFFTDRPRWQESH